MASMKFSLLCLLLFVVSLNLVLGFPDGILDEDKVKQIGLYGDDPYERLFSFLEKADATVRSINSRIHQFYNVANWWKTGIRNSTVGHAWTDFKAHVKGFLNIKSNKPADRKYQTPTELYEDTLDNGCPGVHWQAHYGAEWTRIPTVFLKDALDIDFEGVLARGCLSVPDQKRYLFGEYKFKRDAGTGDELVIDPSGIVANDKVPLMSYVARQGARKFRKLQNTTATRCEGASIEACLNATRVVSLTELGAKFPWAAPYVEHECTWVFNTAGQGYAHLCYIYGSVTENVVFWGSPIGNQGFSGSYDAKVWDHMLAGVMETFEAGHIQRLTQYPGQFHLLNRWSGNYYRISRDCYMLDYVQGNVAQSLKFAIIAPTRYSTLDFRSAMKSICQYATLVIKNLDGQGVFPSILGNFIRGAWLELLGAKGGDMSASVCKFDKGIDSNAIGNMEGEPLTDDEGLKFKLTDLPCEQYKYLVDQLKSAFHSNSHSKNNLADTKQQLNNLKASTGFKEANCAPVISDADLANLIKSIPQ